MTKVIEYAPHLYCAYTDLGNGKYASITYTEETLLCGEEE